MRLRSLLCALLISLVAAPIAQAGNGTGANASCISMLKGANACVIFHYDDQTGQYQTSFARYTGQLKDGLPDFKPAPSGVLVIRPARYGFSVVLNPGHPTLAAGAAEAVQPHGCATSRSRILSGNISFAYAGIESQRNVVFDGPYECLRLKSTAFATENQITGTSMRPTRMASGYFSMYDASNRNVIQKTYTPTGGIGG